MTERGYFGSREKAKAAIMAGLVLVDGKLSDKAGTAVSSDAVIELQGNDCPYVSRGGLKLEKALRCFDISVKTFHCVDIGTSTKGFRIYVLFYGNSKFGCHYRFYHFFC